MNGGSIVATLGTDSTTSSKPLVDRCGGWRFFATGRLTHRLQVRLAPSAGWYRRAVARVRFVTVGAEGIRVAIRPAHAQHVARGVESPASHLSYTQDSTMPDADVCAYKPARLKGPLRPYVVEHLPVPPCTLWLEPTGQAALDALRAAGEEEEAGLENIERERATLGRTDA